jgi:hypothetical protein
MAPSKAIDCDDCFGECARGFLRQVVPDAAGQEPVRVLAGEFLRIRTRVRVWRTIRITLTCDGVYGDRWTRRKPLFHIVVLRVAIGQPEAPAVVVDHEVDMIGVVEHRGNVN